MEEIGEGSVVKTLGQIRVNSRATGRAWEVPKGKRLRVTCVTASGPSGHCFIVETLDGLTWAIVGRMSIEPCGPLEQLAACAED